jgi:hypothetical protein
LAATAPQVVADDRRGSIRRDRVIWLGIAAPILIVGTLYAAGYVLWLWHLSCVIDRVKEVGQPVVQAVYRFREAKQDWPTDHEALCEFLGEDPRAFYYQSNAGPTVSVKVGREASARYIFDPSHPQYGWFYGDVRLDVPPPATNRKSDE